MTWGFPRHPLAGTGSSRQIRSHPADLENGHAPEWRATIAARTPSASASAARRQPNITTMVNSQNAEIPVREKHINCSASWLLQSVRFGMPNS
jgi:hypothetical protein